MLAVVRRGAASLPRTLCSIPSSARSKPATSFLSSNHARIALSTPSAASRTFHQNARWQQQAAAAAASGGVNQGPIVHFADLETRGMVHPAVVRTITDKMKIDTMTDVQTATINESLGGRDVIAQAKTGTGKTLAFLVPLLQNIINSDPSLGDKEGYARRRTSPDNIRAIIVSPTRELAEQIAVEAKKLTQDTNVIVQTAVGGTQKRLALMQAQREGCHILVGTPGRLNDVLSDPTSGLAAPQLSAFVLDEADRLLDQGFWPEIQSILESLPDPQEITRQTMMFSATIPRDVVELVRRTLRPDFQYVKCVRDDEEPTHERVPQRAVATLGLENQVAALVELCQRGIEEGRNGGRPFKAIVFFNTTAEVDLASQVLTQLGSERSTRSGSRLPSNHPLYPAQVIEMHSKLSQGQRQRHSDTFKAAESAILVSSDVTARGMDFPNVTHVIQVSAPRDRDSYIHRIGRTARAGKEGQGWLILSPFERKQYRRTLYDLPIVEDNSLVSAKVDMSRPADIPANVAQLLTQLGQAYRSAEYRALEASYRAYLSLYSSVNGIVDDLNRMALHGWGMKEPPSVDARFAQMKGLSREAGLNIRSFNRRDEGGDRGGFGGGRGGFGNRGGSYGRGGSSGRGSYDRDGGSRWGDSQGNSMGYGGDSSQRQMRMR